MHNIKSPLYYGLLIIYNNNNNNIMELQILRGVVIVNCITKAWPHAGPMHARMGGLPSLQ